MNAANRIFLALDGLSACQALQFTREACESSLGRAIAGVKIHDLYDREGPNIIPRLREAGAPNVWADAKIYDTPKTAGFRAAALKDAGADIVTVHASGGVPMMRRAVEMGPHIFGVIILTSLSEAYVRSLYKMSPANTVIRLALDAMETGIFEIVCSPNDVAILASREYFRGLRFTTPGIRLGGKEAVDDNQKRVNTPYRAFENGATHIVLGSEFTNPTDTESRLAVLEQVVEQIQSVPR